jgi:hypothetical protein
VKLNGTDLISRSTQNSARLLLSSSFAVTLVEYFNLKPLNWPGINGEVPAAAYEFGAGIVIAFLCISLSVHWYSDIVAYRAWFKTNRVSIGTLEGLSSASNTETPLAAVNRRLEWISEDLRNLDELSAEHAKLDDRLKNLARNLNDLDRLLGEIDPNFRRLNGVAKFVLFGWYMLLPLGGGLVAILALCLSS